MGIVPIGRVGKIISGDDAGWFVKVLDDSAATGGFLILTSRDDHCVSGFDNWVADENALEQYLHEARWLIEWAA
jgi:hypothetical protein